MNIKSTITLILGFVVLPAVSSERKVSEAMELLGIEYAPIEYELQDFGEDIKMVDRDLPARPAMNKSHKSQTSPFDDLFSLFTSIKAQLFEGQTSQLMSKKLLDTSSEQKINVGD
jgi:hypothetical protein